MDRLQRHEALGRDLYAGAIRRARMMYPDGTEELIKRVAHSLLSSAQELAFAGAYYPVRSAQVRPALVVAPVEDREITKPYDRRTREGLRKKTLVG